MDKETQHDKVVSPAGDATEAPPKTSLARRLIQQIQKARNAVELATTLTYRRSILLLALVAVATALLQLVIQVGSPDPTTTAWKPAEISLRVQDRLDGIRQQLDSGLELLQRDVPLHDALEQGADRSLLFPRLGYDFGLWLQRMPDSVRGTGNLEIRDTAGIGVAIYTTDFHLLAWSSSMPGGFVFDTLLPSSLVSERYIQTIRLEKSFFHSYLTETRKLTGTRGVIGYVIAKRLLGSDDLAGGNSSTGPTFVDDLREPARREFEIRFGSGVKPDSAFSGQQVTLIADRADRASQVGLLQISRTPVTEPAQAVRTIHGMFAFSIGALLILLLGWGLAGMRGLRIRRHPIRTRLGYSVLTVGMLLLTRYLFVWLDLLTAVFGPQLRETSEFASDWGFGLVQNPLELFATMLALSLAAVFLWIIWVPRKRLVRDDVKKRNIESVVSRDRLLLICFSFLAIAVSAGLIDVLSILLESLVSNGSVQYFMIRQVMPSPSLLMMYLSLLSAGVAFLFLTLLLHFFALRSFIFLMPRDLSFIRRFVVGSLIFLSGFLIASELLDQLRFSETGTLYRLLLALSLGVTTIILVASDTFIQHPFEQSPSFLFRLPRTSRSILFILALSAVVVSPLVAAKELVKDREIAQGIVLQNAQADTPYLKTVIEQSLADVRSNIANWSTGGEDAIRQSAFLIWVSNFRDHADWQAVIDVTDGTGRTVSHFGTTNSSEVISLIRARSDSLMRRLGGVPELDSLRRGESPMLTLVQPTFAGSSSALVVGAAKFPALSDPASEIKGPLTFSIALWNQLPVLQPDRPSLDFGRPTLDESRGTNDVIANGEFIVAEYLGGARSATNVPTLDVPTRLPAFVEARSRREFNFWRNTTIDGKTYQTLYHRMPSISVADQQPSIITVSVPVPTLSRALEFGLRLNAIGLLYGIALAVVLLTLRQLGKRKVRFTLKFRDRIFLIVLSIALLPLVVVTNVTRSLLYEPAASEERDRLARDASVIRDKISREMESGSPSIFGFGLQQDVSELAHTIGRNFSVFDSRGMLLASSRPEYYESSLLANHLSSTAMRQVVLGKQTFFTEPISLGPQRYQIGYQPITSRSGGALMGVVSVAAFGNRSRTDAEIARTTSLIYGTFAALGLILLAIGALFAARVASPILALIHATERVAQGKLRTSLPVNREDEIGELMHAFNTMTSELDKSRQLVAQTEREVAWKEMARQVAHEIKNPLTPMKLSVQHLEHAQEAKDPNFNTIFKRVVSTLSEQIDVLTRIATEFARFGEMPRRKYALVAPRRVAERAVALFDADRHHIRFIIDISPATPWIFVDEEELRRALVNLIRNAIQATEGWGVVAIRTSFDREMVHIKISDTGAGMNEETLKKAFDPNFSTKTSGMGLGLAIVKKTINDMGGIITVESTLGKGTTFAIDLPARGKPEETT